MPSTTKPPTNSHITLAAVELIVPAGGAPPCLSFVADWAAGSTSFGHCYWALLDDPAPPALLSDPCLLRDLVTGARPAVTLRWRHLAAALGCEVVRPGAPAVVELAQLLTPTAHGAGRRCRPAAAAAAARLLVV
eukprot:gene5217-38303_t